MKGFMKMMTAMIDEMINEMGIMNRRMSRTTKNDIMNDIMADFEKEHEEKTLQVVVRKETVERDGSGRLIKYYKETTRSYFTDRHHKEYNGVTLQKYTWTIKPRKFTSVHDGEMFVEDIKRRAGRTLEDAEITLILRHVIKGQPYELVCVRDVTKEFKDVPVYEDIK